MKTLRFASTAVLSTLLLVPGLRAASIDFTKFVAPGNFGITPILLDAGGVKITGSSDLQFTEDGMGIQGGPTFFVDPGEWIFFDFDGYLATGVTVTFSAVGFGNTTVNTFNTITGGPIISLLTSNLSLTTLNVSGIRNPMSKFNMFSGNGHFQLTGMTYNIIPGSNPNVGAEPTATPEPSTWAMLGLGVTLIGAAQRRRNFRRMRLTNEVS